MSSAHTYTRIAAVPLFAAFAVASVNAQQISVGPNVQVSRSSSDREHNEVVLLTDAENSKHLVASSMVLNPNKNADDVKAYISDDGGRSWSQTLEVNAEMGGDSDPSLAIGPDGTIYLASLATVGRRDQNHVLLHRSKDGGKTWLPPVTLPYSDREYVLVDCTGSPYRGRVYVYGNVIMTAADGARVGGTRILRSEDGGLHFAEVDAPPAPGRFSSYQGIGAVLADGTLLVPFVDISADLSGPRDGVFRVLHSTDGGTTFSPATMIARIGGSPGRLPDVALPNLAADLTSGVFRDRVYAVWTDKRGESRSAIMLSYSTDGGVTWARPAVVDDAQPFPNHRRGPDNFMPEVAVNAAGVVGVSWYDRRNSSNDLDWEVRFTASFDGGKTFAPSVRVSEAPFKHQWTTSLPIRMLSHGGGDFNEEGRGSVLQIGMRSDRSFLGGGDTAGLVADADGAFHALWIDNRTGTAQVWTAPLTVQGVATRNGSSYLSDLTDITGKVTIKFGEVKYDLATKTVSCLAHVVNNSSETLGAPIVMRVLGFESGVIEVLNSDNGLKGVGASWNFTSLLSGGGLAPGNHTPCKLLQFRVPGVGNPTRAEEREFLSPFPQINVEVLGKTN